MLEVIFYETEIGYCPVAEYLDSLSSAQAKKVAWVIELIEAQERVCSKFLKKLKSTEGLWEIRVEYEGNIFRLLSFFDEGQLLVASHGFTKKSQKTSRSEIQIAVQRKRDYFNKKRIK